VTDTLVRLEQHVALFEFYRLQMRSEKFRVGRREQAEQKILHGAILIDRREREELSAIGALAGYPIIPGRYVNYRT
jgi:hypothetical protein